MRWDDVTPDGGALRVKSGFLFFPKRIGKTTRWLEFARWREIYTLGGRGGEPSRWESLRWLPDVGEEIPPRGPMPA